VLDGGSARWLPESQFYQPVGVVQASRVHLLGSLDLILNSDRAVYYYDVLAIGLTDAD